MVEHKPLPANVPGDFYVKDGCYTCQVPLVNALALFADTKGRRGYLHFFVKRQRRSPSEVDAMLSAVLLGHVADLAQV